MLPLWIIDLNTDEKLRAGMKRRVDSLPGTDKNWRYTNIADVDFSNESWFADYVQNIVETGQQAIRELKSIKPINECCLNVCVIGNSTQEFSLKFFSSLAALIKKEKGRIIPGHIHQGINILGMLYVRSDVHNLDFKTRQAVLRCFRELDVQHEVNLAAGYDKVMLFQDTQRRTAKVYPLLDEEQRLDYLLQCLIHLYYVCDVSHPLLDGNGSNDDFFFSMGVGSLYYDTNEQDEKDLRFVGNNLLAAVKAKGTVDSMDQDISIFDQSKLHNEALFDVLKVDFLGKPSLETLGLDRPNVDPIENFGHRHLMQFFYKGYLVLYPTKLLNKIVEKIADSSRDQLEQLNTRMDAYYSTLEEELSRKLFLLFKTVVTPEVGCFTLIKNKLKSLKEAIVKQRETVDEQAEVLLWQNIIMNQLPQRLHDAFNDYHICFNADQQNNGHSCDDMKKEATEKLTGILSREKTVLSTMARCFLYGIIVALAIVPILNALSPLVFNLGDVNKWSFIWAAVIFLIPITLEYWKLMRYTKKRKRVASRLIAYYLHDAYARLINRAKNQTYTCYDKLYDLCNEYDKRCDQIIADTDVIDEAQAYKLEIPKSVFNQPVVGGEICGEEIFNTARINNNIISVQGSLVKIEELNINQQYTIIREYPALFMSLFDGVHTFQNIYRNQENGQIVINTEEDKEAQRQACWEATKQDFHNNFVKEIKAAFIPRQDNSIAKKLLVMSKDPNNKHGFELFAAFCEPNGEFVANDDKEFSDIKTNSAAVKRVFEANLPIASSVCQVVDQEIYNSFLVMTKWRTFDHISPNRVLPEVHLFDKEIFESWENPPKSSLILYSALGNMSGAWFRLFGSQALSMLPEKCKSYVEEIQRRK